MVMQIIAIPKVVMVDKLKVIAKVKSDLNWFFNHSAAAVGFHSSHSAFVAALYGSQATMIDPDPYTDGLLRQIKKYRRIHDQLYSLPTEPRRLLEACYNQEYRYPVKLIQLYGAKAGAVLFNTSITTLPALIKLCDKKIKSTLSDQEKVTMFLIGTETQELFDRAHQAYALNWKKR